MLSIPKYPEQYAQHFPAIFYLLCCASQHHVVVCLDTLTWVVYPVSVPCHLNHSYAVEVYFS